MARKGIVSARLYDKPTEIATKSHKEWMYDIWGIRVVPDKFRLIRVEFQVRRDAIKELGINTLADLLMLHKNLWAYCTREWLKFQDDAKKHHTQQETMQWWKIVQEGFSGGQAACPLVRAKAVAVAEKQLLQQLLGQMTSLAALYHAGVVEADELVELQSLMQLLGRTVKKTGMDDQELTKRVKEKIAKLNRKAEKFEKATSARKVTEVVLETDPTKTEPEQGNKP
jgi:hypothetical protein